MRSQLLWALLIGRIGGNRSGLPVAICLRLLLVTFTLSHSPRAVAQGSEPKPLPSTPPDDADWTYYCDPSHRVEALDQLKCIGGKTDSKRQVSISGEVRMRGEYFDHIKLGEASPSSGYLLQRYILNTDVVLGDRVRLFTSLESGLEDGRVGGPRPSVDEDRLFFHEGFLQLRSGRERPLVDLRIGRHELNLGSGRLISSRDLPNVQQNFDGVRVLVSPASWQVNFLALKYSESNHGIFDDYPDPAFSVWGIYATRHGHRDEATTLDIYYLGIDHKVATFQAGSGREQRESVGVRLAGTRGHWDHDSETVFQFGTFAYRPIRAWTVTSNSGYTIRSRPRQEIDYRLGLDGGIASGNHNPTEGTFGTFNALFPKGAYFGEANFIGPYNIQDIRPSLRVTMPQRRIVIWPNAEMLWRQSREDGIYSIPGVLVQAGNAADALYIGFQADLNVQWEQNRHFTWAVDGAHFFSGAFLRQTTSGKSVNFFAPSVSYRF
jgi:Alginate export